jgi:NADPH-dependent ferric siderophore reductase
VTQLRVTSSEDVTPSIRRVWFESEDPAEFRQAFAESSHTDRYLKLVFPQPGVTYPEPLDMKALRGSMPAEDLPVVRTYTALYPDLEAGTLAIDFVTHGDLGVAGPWAQAAQPGDRLLVNGPGGAYAPDPAADWHLLVGDESAVPAITAALEALPADAVARVVVLVDDADHEPALPARAGAEVTFLHRATLAEGESLEASVRAMEFPAGRVHAFVHGEAQEVMHGIRPHLLKERGLERDQVSISGYWRRGRTEEGFREWKQELAKAEA